MQHSSKTNPSLNDEPPTTAECLELLKDNEYSPPDSSSETSTDEVDLTRLNNSVRKLSINEIIPPTTETQGTLEPRQSSMIPVATSVSRDKGSGEVGTSSSTLQHQQSTAFNPTIPNTILQIEESRKRDPVPDQSPKRSDYKPRSTERTPTPDPTAGRLKPLVHRQDSETSDRKLTAENKEPRRVLCEICDKTYSTRSIMLEHQRRVHQQKKFVCAKCQRGYATKANLQHHEPRCDRTCRGTPAT